jgi:membrane protease YdiL (CAAX protease family)
LGVYVNAAAFASLMSLALWREKTQQLALSAAIIPVTTMITLILPQTKSFAQAVVFNGALLILALIYRFAFTIEYPAAITRLKVVGYATLLPLMLVIGLLLGLIGYALLHHHTGFSNLSLPGVAVVFVLFAIAEEVYFRGLIQQQASLVIGPRMAAALSAILYTIFTFSQRGDYLSPLFGLIAGVVISITYYEKQNLVLTFTVNATSKLLYLGLLATFVFR